MILSSRRRRRRHHHHHHHHHHQSSVLRYTGTECAVSNTNTNNKYTDMLVFMTDTDSMFRC
jgi:hypothetical protein